MVVPLVAFRLEAGVKRQGRSGMIASSSGLCGERRHEDLRRCLHVGWIEVAWM
jgi:hypothetical protein